MFSYKNYSEKDLNRSDLKKLGRKHPLDTPKGMIKKREREGKIEKER